MILGKAKTMTRKETPGEFLKNPVPAVGPTCPAFAVFAEAPGYYEMRDGQPLVGPSGKKFNQILYKLGIRRRQVYIDNVCRTRLPRDNEELLWKTTTRGRFKTHPDWHELAEQLRNNVERLNTRLVVTLGATALVALFGPEYRNIDSYRGYPFEWGDKWIMPTTHPARTLPGRMPWYFWIIYADIHKGLRIAEEGRHVEPFRIYIPGRKWTNLSL